MIIEVDAEQAKFIRDSLQMRSRLIEGVMLDADLGERMALEGHILMSADLTSRLDVMLRIVGKGKP